MRKIIYFENLQLRQSIGIHDFERTAPQPCRLDIELHVDPGYVTRGDMIEEAIDYDVVRARIVGHLDGRHFNLQETVVQDIMRICFGADERVVGVRVKTAKTHVYPDCSAVGLDYFAVRSEVQFASNKEGYRE